METIRFLRDIENEEKYAMASELAYLQAFNAVVDLGNTMFHESKQLALLDCEDPYKDRLRECRHIAFVMGKVLRDMADRRKRLADVAAGLSDVVFDEECP